MNILDLKKTISEKKLLNLYIFSGEEVAIQDIYIKKIVKNFSGNVLSVETVSSIIPRLKGNSLLSNKPTLFIVRNDKEFSGTESIWKLFEDKRTFHNNTILLVYSSIDKRGKFYKHFEDQIVFFDKLSDEILSKYIRKEIPLSMNYCKDLIAICESDYNRILLEIDKINRLSRVKNISADKAYELGKSCNLIYIPPMGAVFDLLDSILRRNVSEVYRLYTESQRRGDSALAIISLLGSNVKAILQVQTLGNSNNLSEYTGLTGFQIKLAKEKLNYYSDMELIRILKVLQYCEKAIKNGIMESDMVVDYLLVNIL